MKCFQYRNIFNRAGWDVSPGASVPIQSYFQMTENLLYSIRENTTVPYEHLATAGRKNPMARALV